MVTATDAAELRSSLVGIRALVERDLAAAFADLNLSRPERARDELLRFVPVLVSYYGEQAAAFAADWYDDIRLTEAVPGSYRAVERLSPYATAVEPMTRRAVGDLFTDDPLGTLLTLQASAPKYALAAGRETVQFNTREDPRAAGWQRVVRASACGFCRMLAGRGAVYKEGTVHFAAHSDCNCAAVPSWDQGAPEVPAVLYEASKRTTGMTPAQKAQHNAAIQRAIQQYA